MRQLTYNIALDSLSKTLCIQELIAKAAIDVNGSCLIHYSGLHTYSEMLSNMVVILIVEDSQCDNVHRTMQNVIASTILEYSPDTGRILVTDIPISTRNFNCEEIL